MDHLARQPENGWRRLACMALNPPPEPPSDGPQPLELPAGVHRLCACGRSRHGWICDGAHLGSGRLFHEVRLDQPTTLLLCGCGRSQRYPFCDGSHAGSGFQPMKFEAADSKKMFFCGCKASKNQPFCDGGHKNLP